MNSHEAFYVHVQGEQKGPYTIRHLDHLLNSGLIPAETLYWTEGLEQWLPVTDLVPLRVKPRNWRKMAYASGVLLVILLLGAFFGPTIADGWRETTQREFTSEGAYWSARGAVRGQAVPSGKVVQFAPEKDAQVTLISPSTAEVIVRGELIGSGSGPVRSAWKVRMSFNPLRCEWSASDVQVFQE